MKKTYFVSQRFFLQFTSTSSSVCFHCVVVLLSKSCPVVLSSLVSLVGNHLVSSDNSSTTTSSKKQDDCLQETPERRNGLNNHLQRSHFHDNNFQVLNKHKSISNSCPAR